MAQNSWTATGFGNFTTVADWSLGHVPTSSEDAFIGTNGAIVGSGVNETVNSVGTGTSDVLDINGDSVFEVVNGTGPNENLGSVVVEDGSEFQMDGGGFFNLGTLRLNSIGTNTSFVVTHTSQLTGGGNVIMTPNSGELNFIVGNSSNVMLTNVDNDISGTGSIGGLIFVNDGIIETNNSFGVGDMQIWGSAVGGSFENDGHMFADDGGTLELGVNARTATIGNAGLIEALGATTTTKIQIDGNVTIVAGHILLAGPNSSFDEIVSGSLSATLNLDGVFLDGAGVIGGNSGLTLNIDSGSTVDADQVVSLLSISTIGGTITNDGTMEATNDGLLDLPSAIDNNGTILASSGEVIISNTITGSGIVELSSAGTFGTLVDVNATGAVTNNVEFVGGKAILEADNISAIQGNIIGAGAGDQIDARFVAPTVHAVWQQNGGTGKLSLVNNNGTTLAGFNLVGQYTSADFSVVSDGAGGTMINIINPSPPTGTTADMILHDLNTGFYEIYDIGGNAILSAHFLGQVGTDWRFAGLGGFFGSDTTDMILRNSNTGGVEVYDISNNNITGAAFLGTVGLNWQNVGFGDFSSNPGETDMLLRNNLSGAFEVYDIANNQITTAASMGSVGLDWQVGGFGNFSNAGESDMVLRSQTRGIELYDISHNQITNAFFIGTVGLDWGIVGTGNFSSNPGETDVMMRNGKTGAFEVYDIANNQITAAFSIGAVGLNWQVAGFGPLNGAGTSDMVLRNNTGAFEVYDIANNQITTASSMGAVGLNFQVGGFAVDPPTGPITDSSTSQLVQAMAGFGGGSGAALTAAPLSAETTQQQPLLTTPQHT